mmetsp:Transcript_9886/g.15451  ORF Transcript_9886/g.15451 Transcript_9886/m.15451 type:complete len:256 (-) Transcript_9886:1474-2241(-)
MPPEHASVAVDVTLGGLLLLADKRLPLLGTLIVELDKLATILLDLRPVILATHGLVLGHAQRAVHSAPALASGTIVLEVALDPAESAGTRVNVALPPGETANKVLDVVGPVLLETGNLPLKSPVAPIALLGEDTLPLAIEAYPPPQPSDGPARVTHGTIKGVPPAALAPWLPVVGDVVPTDVPGMVELPDTVPEAPELAAEPPVIAGAILLLPESVPPASGATPGPRGPPPVVVLDSVPGPPVPTIPIGVPLGTG